MRTETPLISTAFSSLCCRLTQKRFSRFRWSVQQSGAAKLGHFSGKQTPSICHENPADNLLICSKRLAQDTHSESRVCCSGEWAYRDVDASAKDKKSQQWRDIEPFGRLVTTLLFCLVCALLFSWRRHCLCLVCSTAVVAKTEPLPCGLSRR